MSELPVRAIARIICETMGGCDCLGVCQGPRPEAGEAAKKSLSFLRDNPTNTMLKASYRVLYVENPCGRVSKKVKHEMRYKAMMEAALSGRPPRYVGDSNVKR